MRLLGRDGTEVNPRNYLSRARVHASNARGVPNIGQDFTLDVFQLIQVRHTLAFRVQFDRARHGERGWIDVANLVRAIAHY